MGWGRRFLISRWWQPKLYDRVAHWRIEHAKEKKKKKERKKRDDLTNKQNNNKTPPPSPQKQQQQQQSNKQTTKNKSTTTKQTIVLVCLVSCGLFAFRFSEGLDKQKPAKQKREDSNNYIIIIVHFLFQRWSLAFAIANELLCVALT